MDWKTAVNGQAGETYSLIIMAVIELITIIFYFKERGAKEKAEQELKVIKLRGEAPYITPSETIFRWINFIFEKDEHRMWPAEGENMLNYKRNEVDRNLAPGNSIIFAVDNLGEDARGVTIKLDGKEIALKRETEGGESHGLLYLEYPYEPEKHGKDQVLEISFETISGVQGIHKYAMRHGHRFLKRTYPAMPLEG